MGASGNTRKAWDCDEHAVGLFFFHNNLGRGTWHKLGFSFSFAPKKTKGK